MTETHPNPFLHHIRHLLGSAPAVTLSDGQLLEQFLTNRDESAVELLEWVGNTEARQLLRTLAGGVPGTRLTREAASAVRRLTKQAATP